MGQAGGRGGKATQIELVMDFHLCFPSHVQFEAQVPSQYFNNSGVVRDKH